MKKKTLIVINGNQEAYHGIKVLRKLYKLILIDLNPNCISRKLVTNFIKADIYNSKKVLHQVKKYFKNKPKPDGSLVLSCDAVLSMATINEYFKFKGVKIKNAERTNNKTLFKKFLKKEAIKSSKFWIVSNYNQIKKILIKNPNKKFLLKPSVGRGARGVMLINKINFEKNFKICKKYAKKNDVILEEFISGPQISAEALILNRKSYLCGISDRNYEKMEDTYPYIVEDGGDTPSRYSKLLSNRIQNLLQKISNALKFNEGTIKADLILHKGKIYVVEIALRLSGGDYSTITIPKVYGIRIVQHAAKIAVGEKPNLKNINLKPVKFESQRYLFLNKGVIKKIDYRKINLLKKKVGVKKIDLNIKKNQKVNTPENHPQRHGNVMVFTKNRHKSISLAKQLIEIIFKSVFLKN